jgi:ribosomal protein S18 acetylase RimI-like enzyme
MTDNKIFTIRQMRAADLNQALLLSLNEGWNQTMNDWKLLFENPENVCIVAETDNRVAGTATALNHENKIAWIGMVLVDKSLRGRGAGKMLLENIINRLKHVESVKLDATPAGEPLYRKLGFIEEHKIFRMTADYLNYSSEMVHSEEPDKIDKDNLSEVTKLDGKIFGAGRHYLLMNLLSENPGRAFYFEKDNSPESYIFGRAGSRFNYIGPVCALTQESARNLILKALKSLNDHNIAIDILADKVGMISWLESIGFVKQRHFIRMYLKTNPYPGIVKNQYLISGPEFG